MITKIKLVLHVMAYGNDQDLYNPGGLLERQYKEYLNASSIEFEYISYAGQYLEGEVLENFLNDCSNADIILLDGWNHPNYDKWNMDDLDPYESMANVAKKIKQLNPNAYIFAQRIMGENLKVHQFAIPFNSFLDDIVMKKFS